MGLDGACGAVLWVAGEMVGGLVMAWLIGRVCEERGGWSFGVSHTRDPLHASLPTLTLNQLNQSHLTAVF